MRELVVIEFVTLDGVMQGLGSPDEDREGGFEHGGWAAPFFDEVQGAAAVEGMKSTTAYSQDLREDDRLLAEGALGKDRWPTSFLSRPTEAGLAGQGPPRYFLAASK